MPVDNFKIRSKTGVGLAGCPGYVKRQLMRYLDGWHHLRCIAFSALAVAAPFLSTPAFAANVLERAIEAAQPCKPLKVKQSVLGVKVELGIDKLDFIKVDTLDIRVDG